MDNPNLERLHQAGLFDKNVLDHEQKELIGLLSEAEVAALISAACTLGFHKDEESHYAFIL